MIKTTSNRKQDLPGMSLSVQRWERINLTTEEVDKVFWARLADISEGIFLRGDEIWKVVGTHPHNGDDVDEKVGTIYDSEWELPLLAYRLRQLILKTAVSLEV